NNDVTEIDDDRHEVVHKKLGSKADVECKLVFVFVVVKTPPSRHIEIEVKDLFGKKSQFSVNRRPDDVGKVNVLEWIRLVLERDAAKLIWNPISVDVGVWTWTG